MLLTELRQHFPQRLILIVVVLELLQLGHHRIPAALGDADGEHDEEGIQATLLNDHAVLCQVLGYDGGRDTDVFREGTVYVEPRGDDGRLDRVEHIKAIGQLTEAMPAFTRFQHPGFALFNTFFREIVWAPDFEPPALAPLLIHLAHGTTEVEGLGNRLFHQRRATRFFHHSRCHIARGDNRVLR